MNSRSFLDVAQSINMPTMNIRESRRVITHITSSEIMKYKFIRDLDRVFFFGIRKNGPTNFQELFNKTSCQQILDIKWRFDKMSLTSMKREIENIIKKMGYQYGISYKRWHCDCPIMNRHYYPDRICAYCAVGLKMYDPNFGITYIKE